MIFNEKDELTKIYLGVKPLRNMSGSEKDLNDVKSVLMRQKNLDMVYIKNEAKKEGVDKVLDKLITEIKQMRLK